MTSNSLLFYSFVYLFLNMSGRNKIRSLFMGDSVFQCQLLVFYTTFGLKDEKY